MWFSQQRWLLPLATFGAGAVAASLWYMKSQHMTAASTKGLKIIDADEVRKLLSMPECIDAVEKSLKALSNGNAQMPLRQVVKLPLDNDKLGILAGMPSFFNGVGTENGSPICGFKAITVFPSNVGTHLSAHQGAVLLFDANQGELKSICDAHEITAMRTAAASAVATRLLSNEDASTLCLLGTGTQAKKHAEAICLVRPITKITVWGRSMGKAKMLVRELQADTGLEVVHCKTAQQAVESAHIVCTLTGSLKPILLGDWLRAGTHVNAVGACTPKHRELDTKCVQISRLFCDTRDACLREPGDLVVPMQEGVDIGLIGEVGEVLLGAYVGRETREQITLFKSVGAAVEDLFVANLITEKHLLLSQNSRKSK
eukprot:m.73496 g.73496  ORF g.73496 m.73496 type:complete len:372 (+) comp24564_c0_seq1:91-1206(+)